MIFAIHLKAAGIESKVKMLIERAIATFKTSFSDLEHIKGIYANEMFTISILGERTIQKYQSITPAYIFIEIDDGYVYQCQPRDDNIENIGQTFIFPPMIKSFLQRIPGASIMKVLKYNIPEQEYHKFFNLVSESSNEKLKIQISFDQEETSEVLHVVNKTSNKKLKYTWLKGMSYLDELLRSKRRTKSTSIVMIFSYKLWNDALKMVAPIKNSIEKHILNRLLTLGILDKLHRCLE